MQFIVYTGTQRSLENGPSAIFLDPISGMTLGSEPDKEEELQLSMTVRVEESVEFPVTLSKVAPPSVITASSLEKSRRSSTMKWSPPPPPPLVALLLLLSKEWRFSGVNCGQKLF